MVDDKTDGYMGASEMLLSCAVCGFTFSLLSGQPLLIVGATGPLMVFEEGIYQVRQLRSYKFNEYVGFF